MQERATAATRPSPLTELSQGHFSGVVAIAAVSFLGALLEACFLVLLTGSVLSLAGGQPSIGPLFGHTIPVGSGLVIAAVAVVIRFLLGLAAAVISARLSAVVTTEWREQLSHAFMRTRWRVQQAEPAGRLQELLTGFVGQASLAMTSATQGITAILSLVGFVGTGLLVDPGATAAVLAALVGLTGVLAPLRRMIRKRAAATAGTRLDFTTAVSEVATLGQEIHAFGVTEPVIAWVDELTTKASETQRRLAVVSGALTPVYTFLAYVAILVAVLLLRTSGTANLGAVGSVMLLMLRSLSYGQQLLSVSGTLATSVPFLAQLRESLDNYRRDAAPTGGAIPQAAVPIEFADVSFSYVPTRPALQSVSFTIEPGSMLGVIGPSGAGKSTLAQLLLGLREPTSGRISVSTGVPLPEIDRTWWAKQVSFVPQEPVLLTGTVAENIRFFRPNVSLAEVERAARQANVLDHIRTLPEGFETHLGQRGSQLSGGQKQRISIARALVGQPQVLILDEPTSSLDGHSEALIRGSLEHLHGQVTMVIIAHRMSTLDLCDKIAVIERGHLTALDNPSALRANSEFYRKSLEVAGLW